MKNGKIRDTQLATLIAEELDFVLSSAQDSRLAELTITGVEPKAGAGHFIIYVAPNDDSQSFASATEVKAILQRASGFLRYELSSLLNLKRMPELSFMPDPLYPWGVK